MPLTRAGRRALVSSDSTTARRSDGDTDRPPPARITYVQAPESSSETTPPLQTADIFTETAGATHAPSIGNFGRRETATPHATNPSPRSAVAPEAEARLKAAEYEFACTVADAQRRRAAMEENITTELARMKWEAAQAAVRAEFGNDTTPQSPESQGVRPRAATLAEFEDDATPPRDPERERRRRPPCSAAAKDRASLELEATPSSAPRRARSVAPAPQLERDTSVSAGRRRSATPDPADLNLVGVGRRRGGSASDPIDIEHELPELHPFAPKRRRDAERRKAVGMGRRTSKSEPTESLERIPRTRQRKRATTRVADNKAVRRWARSPEPADEHIYLLEGMRRTSVTSGRRRAPSSRISAGRRRSNYDADANAYELPLSTTPSPERKSARRRDRARRSDSLSDTSDSEWEYAEPRPPATTYGGEQPQASRHDRHHSNDLRKLAQEIKKICRPPASLPTFDGDLQEFLSFRAAYRETTKTHNYSGAENLTRLRNALRGEAKQAVAALLHTGGDPEAVMKNLELRFAHPDAIISLETRRVRDLPHLTESNRQLSIFACTLQNCVSTVKALGNPAYLHAPELIRTIQGKLTPLLRSRYTDYVLRRRHNDTPGMEILSEFLTREARRAAIACVYDPAAIMTQTPRTWRIQRSRRDTAQTAPTRAIPAHTTAPAAARAAAAAATTTAYTSIEPAPLPPPGRAEPTALRYANRPALTRLPAVAAGRAAYTYTIEATGSKTHLQCAHCTEPHTIASCDKFTALSVDDRWGAIRATGSCFKCLRGKHRWTECRARPCGVSGCSRPHHRLLHQLRRARAASAAGRTKQERENVFDNPTVVSCARASQMESDSAGATDNTRVSELDNQYPQRPSATDNTRVSELDNQYPQRPSATDNARASETDNSHLRRPGAPNNMRVNKSDNLHLYRGALEEERIGLLEIAQVTIRGPLGDYDTLAMLDSGSVMSFVEDDAAARIGAQGPPTRMNVLGFGGQRTNRPARAVDFGIKARDGGEWHDLRRVRTIDDLGLGAQTVDRAILDGCSHLAVIKDKLIFKGRPTVIVGQDHWYLLKGKQTLSGKKHSLVATLTLLGWVLHGYTRNSTPQQRSTFCVRAGQRDDELHRLVKANYDLEALGVAARAPRVPTDERAIATLAHTTRKRTDGRYEVGLLWKENEPEMPASESQALTRLKSIEHKMRMDAEFESKYRSKMAVLIDSGYAERCPAAPPNGLVWYLPHFTVKNPRKKGKIRIVFDAAARTQGVSLNDQLLAGPDLLQSLLGILMRFREGAVAVAGDIKDMFLRVIIRQEDRDAQRFLWRDTPEGPPLRYRMRSLIFGATSSPCTALYVKNVNARASTNEQNVVTAIERDHYMDDALLSTDTSSEAAHLVREVTRVHAQGGFEIRGWTSNEPAALRCVVQEARGSVSVDLTSSGVAYERTLGLIWNTECDEFAFDLSLYRVPAEVAAGSRKPTKRQMLSLVMSIYDPLGLLSPITTGAKVLLQHVWRATIGWDDELTEDLHSSWISWLRHLEKLRTLKLPRHYGTRTNSRAELHVFCDASTEAYAAVAYWREATVDESRVRIALVASKSRVAPLRPVSVPRLELQAAVLGTRLAATIVQEHRMQPTSTTFWSDSRTALTWIREDAKRYKPFVAHRVAEIQECTSPEQWRWVPTAQNAADLATRSPPSDFGTEHWWFNGPAFLAQHRGEWPQEKISATTEATSEEKIKERTALLIQAPTSNAVLPAVDRFSNWTRLIRATSRVLQFVERLRQRIRERSATTAAIINRKRHRLMNTTLRPLRSKERRYAALSNELIQAAEALWIKASQQSSFSDEITLLRKRQPIKNSSRLATLAPRLDADGVLRPMGRINAAAGVEAATKEPALLDGREPYARLLILHYHVIYRHGNHETVINELRQRYWILRLRGVLKSVTHACAWCRLHKGNPCVPPPGDLPRARLMHHRRPFTATGIDYFGPMEVTVGRRREKRWGAIFTCLTTRAVHIELAASLSADSMILALRRMSARRGTPTDVYTDNGTNFIGARRELAEAREELEAVGEAAQQLNINWLTIPPGAPNMGGSWERLVRSVKTALRVTLHERAPREEVLTTILLEAEHTVNCRPLTHVSAHHEADEALTPNHFLIGASSGAPVLARTSDRDLVGKASWRSAQRLADHFWSRWVKEYLPLLQPRGRPGHGQDLVVGDLVLIGDPTMQRNIWPRGRVAKVYPGPDGRVRVVDVDTAAGLLQRRPVRRLVRLLRTEKE